MMDAIKKDFEDLLERYKTLFFRSSDIVLKFSVDYAWRTSSFQHPVHEIYVTVFSNGEKIETEKYNIRRVYNEEEFFDINLGNRLRYQKEIIRSMMFELFDYLVENAKVHNYRSIEQELEREKMNANRLKITCSELKNITKNQSKEISSLRRKLCQKLSRKY